MKPIRTKLAAAAAVGALLTTAALASAGAASASAAPPRASSAALRAALHRDLTRYLTARRTAEHIFADSLRVTFPGSRPPISLATGTTRYHGGPPVSDRALWQIGSNTKAFTAVILLQLEAEGKLSISDPIGKWLPQYPAWRNITIRQLLDMTSRIPDYLYQPAFDTTFAADPATRFTAARLVSYVQPATGSASSKHSIPRPASSGTTKARPSAPGSCTSTSPAPACSSRSPPTAKPPTTTCPTCPERSTRPCTKQAQYTPAEPTRKDADTGHAPRAGRYPRLRRET